MFGITSFRERSANYIITIHKAIFFFTEKN